MDHTKEYVRGIKFTLFSVSAGAIELGSFALLDGLTDWHYWIKYLIALTLSVLWNFTLNLVTEYCYDRFFVFTNSSTKREFAEKLEVKYSLCSIHILSNFYIKRTTCLA